MPPKPQVGSAPKPQYQHYIPRFILRKFLEAQGPPKTSKQRSKEYRKAKKKGVETELLNVYNLSTQTLQLSPISTNFGEVNLYIEITSGINSQHVEEKLSRLENEAAKVITAIQEVRGQGDFVLTQPSLDVLHKFVYIMHYRKPNIRAKYFNVNPADPLADWIQRYMHTHQIETPEDLWLHGLAYILDTSHPEIISKGEQIYAQYGAKLIEMVSSKIDPNLENWFAIDYRSLMNSHYFGVWEAAPGCEFIMGNNCFGLWEGLLMGRPDIHRIFIISPKLVLVLRSNSLRRHGEETLRPFIRSALADVAMPSPTPHGGVVAEPNGPSQRHGTAVGAQKDAFTYKVTKLTEAQTREVNEVVLLNVKRDGAVVFASKEYMLKAIRYHITSPDTIVQSQNPYEKFSALLFALERIPNLTRNTTAIESDADFRLRVVLEVLRRRLVQFRSEWDSCYWCYRAMTADPNQTHPLVTIMRIRLSQAAALVNVIDEKKSPHKKPSAHIVDSLSKVDSDHVLGCVGMLLKMLVGDDEVEPCTDQAHIKDSTMVGLVEWMAKEQPDLLNRLVGPTTYERLTQVY